MSVPFLYISADKKYPTAENEVASVLHPPTVFLPENQASILQKYQVSFPSFPCSFIYNTHLDMETFSLKETFFK